MTAAVKNNDLRFCTGSALIFAVLSISMVGTRKWLDWLAAIGLGVTSAAVVFWQNARLAVIWDLSYILENSFRISLGDVPYRDFPFPYAPLTFLTQAALIKLTGRVFFHHVIYCAVVCGLSVLLTWRIILFLLRALPGGRVLALLLIAPLTLLGIYAIYPHPFYDPDCTFAILASLLLLVRWFIKPTNILGFITGITLAAPLFFKQNAGLAFLTTTLFLLVLLISIDLWQRRSIRGYFSLLAGLLFGLGSAVLLIHSTAGLGNYIRWTIKFAAERRTPQFAEMIGVYRDPPLKWWIALLLLCALTICFSRGRRLLIALSLIAMSAPFVWSVLYLLVDSDSSERAERLVGLWPLILIVSLLAILFKIRRRRAAIDVVLPLIVIGTVHGAFLSQQLWGSTYALWPFFMILLAGVVRTLFDLAEAPFKEFDETFLSEEEEELVLKKQPAPGAAFGTTSFSVIVTVSLLVSGFFYVRSHERLDYANLDDGDLTHSKRSELRGLSLRGSWIPDFEELVAYSDKEIPRGDGVLCLPGEDLFYYTTGRRPQFPVLMFDHTVNPYSPQEIVDVARSRNIQWLIVKNELQLEEEPIEKKEELMSLLMKEFESVESLDNYEIYKRKSADSEDDTSSDDESDSP